MEPWQRIVNDPRPSAAVAVHQRWVDLGAPPSEPWQVRTVVAAGEPWQRLRAAATGEPWQRRET